MFYIKKTKLLKNGDAPVCLRITVNCQYAEVMIKRSVPAHLWDQKKECSKGKAYSDKELNHYLDSVKTRVFLIQREMETEGRQVLRRQSSGIAITAVTIHKNILNGNNFTSDSEMFVVAMK